MVSANQKSTIDTHTKKKKESKHNTKLINKLQEKRTKKGREEKRPTKTNPKQ